MGLAFAATGARKVFAVPPAGPRRVVSMDYALTETMLAMGTAPMAMSNVAGWETWVGEPRLPEGIIEIGSDTAPNFELLVGLKPDLILTTPYLDLLRPTLDTIAPTSRIGIYDAAPGTPFGKARDAAIALGAVLGLQDAARGMLDRTDAALSAYAARIEALPSPPPPLHVVSFIDPRHVWIYGSTSLFQGVLDRLGLANAWTRPTNEWGFAAIGIEELAAGPASRLVGLRPIPADVMPTLERSPLWRELPFVRAGAVSILPTILRFGALTSALRFAEHLVADLERAQT